MSLKASEMESFFAGNNINSLGRLCIALFVTHALREMSYPYSIIEMLSKGGGQIKGLNGNSISKLMSRHGVDIDASVFGEAGRTNRGSVRDAEILVAWLNELVRDNDVDTNVINIVERFIVGKVMQLLNSESALYSLLPTVPADYIGPRFELANDSIRLQLSVDRAVFDSLSVGLIEELRTVTRALNADLRSAHNVYHTIRRVLERYQDEIDKPVDSIRIAVVYSLGLQIENNFSSIGSEDSDEPPLSAERVVQFNSLIALNGVFVANTDEGRRLLNSAAVYSQKQIDIGVFKDKSSYIVSIAAQSGVIEKESAQFIINSISSAGCGSTPHRTSDISILSVRNMLSTAALSLGTFLVGKAVEHSVVGVDLFTYSGHFFDISCTFFSSNAQNLASLANIAPDLFGWLPRFLSWLEYKLRKV
jgi:hypothetical protein